MGSGGVDNEEGALINGGGLISGVGTNEWGVGGC